MSMGNFPESLSQAILAGTISVGRLGVAGLATESRTMEHVDILAGTRIDEPYFTLDQHYIH